VKLTPNEIRERVTLTIACSSPEMIRDIPSKVKGYVDELEKQILECKICGGVTLACPNCMKADEVCVWIRHNLKKLEKELEKK